MKLHLDRYAFGNLLSLVSMRTGYRQDILEKDYYVVLILKELSQRQKDGLQAYFKGGTALYKTLKTLHRFSEDIDLSVDTRGCSNSQNKARLERATKKYSSLTRNPDLGVSYRSEIIAIYEYQPISDYDKNDTLQRFGTLKVDANSFTIGEPTERIVITSLLYDFATDEEKKTLKVLYDVVPVDIFAITIERIFVDKLFAAEAYLRNADIGRRAFDASKHIYDLAILSEQPRIIDLLQDEVLLERLLSIRMVEELNRLDGIANVEPREFILFEHAVENSVVRRAYNRMLSQYVFAPENMIDYDSATSTVKQLGTSLFNNRAWLNCHAPNANRDYDIER